MIYTKEKRNYSSDQDDNDKNSTRKIDISLKEDRIAKDSHSINQLASNVPSSASLFQPYLDIEKK